MYKNDKEFSEKCEHFFDEYYKSEEFKNRLRLLRQKGAVDIVKLDRDDNPIFQKETYLDAIMDLSCGSSLKIDEKVERWYPYYNSEWLDNYSVEVVSNPNQGGKHDGWAYHTGTTIVKIKVLIENGIPIKFVGQPVIFTLSKEFIEDICRSETYKYIPNKSTDGLYNSGYKRVPRSVLEKYW